MEDGGLRARKKLATREALSRAALRLALERGLENVRVEDIAAAAGVSPRTYNNYFSSREEAICALRSERADRIAAALRARPAGEPLRDAVITAMREYVGDQEPDKAAIQMMLSAPSLRGEFYKGVVALEAPLAEAIADRIGADPACDLRPRVLAAAVSGAVRVATHFWLRPGSTEPFSVLLGAALDELLT
ncbi:MAG: TetR family transcriptional regulator [Actinomycetia bacterium]|nr:TetR family transcriptional regulator [Actinomycetes bacterium]